MQEQQKHPLAKQDINQLISLSMILKERNLSRAAKLLDVTQSAMSHNLSKARTKYDDALLVRQGQEMVRTPFAERLLHKLEPLVENARLALDIDGTDKDSVLEEKVTICMPSVLLENIGLSLYQRVRLLAPHIHLTLVENRCIEPDLIIGNKEIEFDGVCTDIYHEIYCQIGGAEAEQWAHYLPCTDVAVFKDEGISPVLKTESWALFSQLLQESHTKSIVPFSCAQVLKKTLPTLNIAEMDSIKNSQWFIYKKNSASDSRVWLEEQIKELILGFLKA